MKFSFDTSKLRWTSIGCASDFCGKTGSPHAREILNGLVAHLEKQFGNKTLDDMDFRIHANGCPNNCCATMITEIGLSGKQIREDNGVKQTYDILLGGGFDLEGAESSFGRLVEEKVSADELKYKITSLLRNYLNKRDASESLREFCNRHTDEELKEYLNTTGG